MNNRDVEIKTNLDNQNIPPDGEQTTTDGRTDTATGGLLLGNTGSGSGRDRLGRTATERGGTESSVPQIDGTTKSGEGESESGTSGVSTEIPKPNETGGDDKGGKGKIRRRHKKFTKRRLSQRQDTRRALQRGEGQSIVEEPAFNYRGKTNFDLETIKHDAEEMLSGRRTYQRLREEAERGRRKGGRRNVEASLILARNTGASEGIKTPMERARFQEALLEKYARQEGIWFGDNLAFEPEEGTEVEGLGIFINSGFEAQVYADTEAYPGFVRKAIRNFESEDLLTILDEKISIHNWFAASVPYEVEGFARNENGQFLIIVNQPYIKNGRNATQEEIENHFKQLEWEKDGRHSYAKGDYSISDVDGKNVLVDEGGILHFIDTIPLCHYPPNANPDTLNEPEETPPNI